MLTERRIRDAKPDSKTRFLWDAQVRNLGVRITPKGAKSYVVFYRSAGQKHRAHSRFPGHALTPTGVMAIRCKQFHLPDL